MTIVSSMDISDPFMASPRRVYTAEEWEQKRGLITGLYLNGISQKELLNLLAHHHNFRPSLSMLKKRIRKWGIDRKNKKSDILAALRLVFWREAQGKRKTEFMVRGHVVKREEIDRYLRRKGIRDVCAFAMSVAQPSSPPPVTAYTPCQSPALSEKSVSDTLGLICPAGPLPDDVEYKVPREEAGSLLPIKAPLPMRPDIYISPPLADCPQLELLQQALVLNREYFDSISESSSAWKARTSNHEMFLDLSEPKELKDFTVGMWKGRDLLMEGQLRKAFKCFNLAFASIHGILQNRSRKFLPELYEMLLNFQLDEQRDVLQPLLHYVVKMSRVNCPSQQKSHNISKIALCLLRMNRADQLCAVEQLLYNVRHRFQSDLAYDQREALAINKALSCSTFCRMQILEAITYLTKLLQDDRSIHGLDSYENCLILFELAKCYRFQNRPDDAIPLLNKALDRAARLETPHSQADIKVRCFRALSWAEGKRNNWHLAHRFARHAVELSTSVLSQGDSLTSIVEFEMEELESEIKKIGYFTTTRLDGRTWQGHPD